MQTKTVPFLNKLLVITLIHSFLLLTLTDAVAAAINQQQNKCEELLAEAENKYFEGLLDQTIELVNTCLNQKEITVEQREKGYKLLGKAYHAKGLLEQAKDNIKKLLELIPNWQPNPNVDTPSFARMAEEVIAEVKRQEEQKQQETEQPAELTEPPPSESKKGGSKALLFIAGGGAIAAGAIVFALAGGGGGEANNRLPDPPPLPGN